VGFNRRLARTRGTIFAVLTRVDRVLLAVPDREEVGRQWESLLDAEPDGEDRVDVLGARRSVYRLGDSCVEILEPDGSGAVSDAVSARGGHLFAAGVATPELDKVVARLRSKGLEPALERGQAHLHPAVVRGGLPLVVSDAATREAVGLADFVYEVTDLRDDHAAASARYADLLGLDASRFVPIESKQYGYTGVLTLFDHSRLDRLEVITPNDHEKTMGRFFGRVGETLYMCFAESGRTGEILERAREASAPYTGDAGGLFLHPAALGGVMLGVSRRTAAWQWSGHPERVEKL